VQIQSQTFTLSYRAWLLVLEVSFVYEIHKKKKFKKLIFMVKFCL
jgi:hypothetical protein